MTPVVIGGATPETRIYALCEFPSQRPRYVGKTIRSLMGRLKSHMRVALRNPRLPVGRWLAKREHAGQMICIKWLETVPPGADWAARERHWISHFRLGGESMLNLTDGGEGLAGHKFSDTHKQRISAALKTGSECSCRQCGAKFWRKANQIKKGQSTYCGRECYGLAQRGVTKASTIPVSAILAAAEKKRSQTHCKRQHLLSGANLYTNPKGTRICKECRKIHKRKGVQ